MDGVKMINESEVSSFERKTKQFLADKNIKYKESNDKQEIKKAQCFVATVRPTREKIVIR